MHKENNYNNLFNNSSPRVTVFRHFGEYPERNQRCLRSVDRAHAECKQCWLRSGYSPKWRKITVEPLMSQIILPMFLLRFCALIVVMSLLSMKGQRALRFHQKYLNLCSEDEQRTCRFGMTQGWAINDNFHFWVNEPFKLKLDTYRHLVVC